MSAMAQDKYLFTFVKVMLIISGLWPLEIPKVSRFWQAVFKIYYALAHVIYLTSPFAFGGALLVDYGVRNAQAAEDFSRMIFVILIVFKLKIIRSKKMKNIINLVTSEEIIIMKNKNKVITTTYQSHVTYCKRMVFFVAVFLWAAGLTNMLNGKQTIYVLPTLINIQGFYELNKWIDANKPRPHIIPFWFPFDTEKHFVLAMAYQIWHIYQTLAINTAILALINSVIVFLRANLKILQYHIRNFYSEKNLKQWVHDLDDSFKSILLLEYCVTSIQLATTLIQIIQLVHLPFNVTFFIHCLLQLFVIAWNANEIMLESSFGLLQALYDTNWYSQGKEISHLIYLMMIRCKRPLVMRIGPLGAMDLDVAVSRVKLAYTCLSVLKVTTEE
ncbi:unnamed protein product [Ceutorhynchus assimilis]|uniref:Odorant receptor n=1 Tax=Ceutorhynchus assimilis TaxID=467358 RepID=A0A9N9ME12_9CUCU|nr:unnamed protein product [Ceutorhynchus assimilis]